MARRIPGRKKKKTFSSVRKIAVEEIVKPREPEGLKKIIIDDDHDESVAVDILFDEDHEDDTTPISPLESNVVNEAETEISETEASPFELIFEETTEDEPPVVDEPDDGVAEEIPKPETDEIDEDVIVETKRELPFEPAPVPLVEIEKNEPAPKPPPLPAPAPEPEPEDLPKILVVHNAVATGRLIRETLENFGTADVDTCPDAVYGFELALKGDYQLYIFALHLPLIEGQLLYELVCKAMRHSSENDASKQQAPGIVFIRERSDPPLPDDLNRDARVKGVLMKPLKIERMLQVVRHALPKKGKVKNSFFA